MTHRKIVFFVFLQSRFFVSRLQPQGLGQVLQFAFEPGRFEFFFGLRNYFVLNIFVLCSEFLLDEAFEVESLLFVLLNVCRDFFFFLV